MALYLVTIGICGGFIIGGLAFCARVENRARTHALAAARPSDRAQPQSAVATILEPLSGDFSALAVGCIEGEVTRGR